MEPFLDQESFFTSPLRDFLTLADMARELRISVELMKKLVEKNGVRCARRCGVVRLWKRSDLETFRLIIERAASRST